MNNSDNPNSIFIRFIKFLSKDTLKPNESPRVVLAIRIMILTVVFYLLVVGLFGQVALGVEPFILNCIFFVVFAFLFASTYVLPSDPAFGCFNLCIILWIFISVHYYGWNIGVQQFLLVLLVLSFYSVGEHLYMKVLFAFVLFILRISMYYLYNSRTPIWGLEAKYNNWLQIINTMVVFWCISYIVASFSTTNRELEAKLMNYNSLLLRQVSTDPLTGLYNRRKALEYMESIIQRKGDYDSFSVCICDIDWFKKVNDTYGHNFGDEVLKSIANLFKSEVEEPYLVARWGGEEFLILFPDTNGDNAYFFLQQLRSKVINLKIPYEDEYVSVTMTFGLSEYGFTGEVESTLKDADDKLYHGKKSGRNIVIY